MVAYGHIITLFIIIQIICEHNIIYHNVLLHIVTAKNKGSRYNTNYSTCDF